MRWGSEISDRKRHEAYNQALKPRGYHDFGSIRTRKVDVVPPSKKNGKTWNP